MARRFRSLAVTDAPFTWKIRRRSSPTKRCSRPDGSTLDRRLEAPRPARCHGHFGPIGCPVARPTTARPQTPKPPFDYQVQDLTIDNPSEKGVRLGVHSHRSQRPGPFPAPAAVLITGSGANDRDDTQFGHKPFAVIADHLARHGIAALRCDDRGVGGSTGDFTAADDADFATDANAAAALS